MGQFSESLSSCYQAAFKCDRCGRCECDSLNIDVTHLPAACDRCDRSDRCDRCDRSDRCDRCDSLARGVHAQLKSVDRGRGGRVLPSLVQDLPARIVDDGGG